MSCQSQSHLDLIWYVIKLSGDDPALTFPVIETSNMRPSYQGESYQMMTRPSQCDGNSDFYEERVRIYATITMRGAAVGACISWIEESDIGSPSFWQRGFPSVIHHGSQNSRTPCCEQCVFLRGLFDVSTELVRRLL